MKSLWKPTGQRGAVLILSALVLPLVIAMAGMAVDIGNIYHHKAVLQNAADAAAIGGAHVGGDGISTLDAFDKGKANEKANQLINDNKKYEPSAIVLGYHKSKSEAATVRYYTVQLEEKVPLYFIKYFLSEDQTVKANAYVKLGAEAPSGGSYFRDLFIFHKKEIEDVNLFEHPGESYTTDQFRATFDGRISYTGNEMPTTNYLPKDTQGRPYFFTEKARKDGLKPHEAEQKDELQFDDAGFPTNSGYYIHPTQKPNYDMNAYWEKVKDKEGAVVNDQNPTSKDLKGKSVVIFDGNKTPNVSLKIDQPLANASDANVDDPIYVIFKDSQWSNMRIQIHVEADTVRPLIFCVDPTRTFSWGRQDIVMEGASANPPHKFRGIIYAPNRNFSTNMNDCQFYGSVISESLALHSTGSPRYTRFVYESFNDGGSNSGSSGGGSGKSGPVSSIDFSDNGGDIDFSS